jgi:uncharacterized protein
LRQQLKRLENCAHRDDSRLTMKSQLIAIVAAVLVVGCGKPQEVKDIQLRTTAKMGNIEGVKKAIADGANVNARDNSGNALNHATANRMPRAHLIGGHKGIVELLIAAGADVNVKNQRGRTPLYDAAIWDRKDIAKLLFDAGADVNAKDDNGETPLDYAIQRNPPETADLLRKHGGKKSEWFKAEESIHIAAKIGHLEAVRQHLAAGADVNAIDHEGNTPLHHAVYKDQTEIIRLLIDKGAEVNGKRKAENNEKGLAPLHTATWRSTIETIEFLIDNGADVNMKRADGAIALHYAVWFGLKEKNRVSSVKRFRPQSKGWQ